MQTPPTGAIRGYDLRQVLGAGGFGVVYRAFQTAVDREVAVKVILPEYANRPEFIRRFEIEAQLVARLEHLHIVPLYDYWREPDGAYLVMRYLRGGSLRDTLRHGPLDARDADRLIDQVSQALGVAHRQRIVHRDIKPENILLDEERNFYLSDFGIAKDLLHDRDATRSGVITGSPGYISPEQALGQELTPRSDLYSLGVVMYEVLAGRHPFQGLAPAAQIARHLTERLPSLRAEQPGLPEALDPVIQTVTAKPPEDRYPDARSFAIALRDALSGRTAQVTVPLVAPVVVDLTNPYKGLRAFESADAADFFGREALTERLLARLREDVEAARFLAVVGPSGSGKSSVVKAGLLPALREGALPGSDRWFVVEVVPGSHPLDELEIGLLRVAADRPSGLMEQLRRDERGLLRAARLAVPAEDGEVLLMIDQFEELFTGQADRGEAEQLLRVVHAAALDPRSRVRVIITLRADFYDRPLLHPDFSRLMQPRTEVVLPLNAEELADAIRKPAEHAGAELEPGLVEAIVADVREQPGALPMLQYALTELFERREGRRLTKAAYDATGRVSGALARRAEDVFVHLDGVQQAAARQLFLRLVTLGEGTEDTRRRTLHGELKALDVDQPALDAVLQAFGKSRLLLFDRDPATREPTVEVAHEALLREWRRLRGWLDESRADVRMQRLLGAAAREWAQAQRDPSFLLRGTRLAQFGGWAAASKVALAQDERAYLEASSAERRAEEAAEAARHQRELAAAQQLAESERRRAEVQAEAARRLKRGALGLAALALVAAVMAGVAFQARSTARTERDHARRAAAVNHSLLLAADARKAFNIGETDLALALGFEAVRLEAPPPEAVQALTAIALGPGTRAVLKGHASEVRAVAFSPDGRYAASGGCVQPDATATCSGGELIVWDLATKTAVHRFAIHAGWINAVAFMPDGKHVLSASGDGTLLLTAVETGEAVRRFEGHKGSVNAVALSPDGLAALSGSDDGTLILWNIATGDATRRFTGHKGPVTSLVFGPPCRTAPGCRQTALSGSTDKNLILWDVATGAIVRTITGHADKVTGVAFLPDGQHALSVGYDLTMREWDLKTGGKLLEQRFLATPECLAVSADGRTAVKQSGASVELWDIGESEWRRLQLLAGHSGNARALAISPDRRYVLSGAQDKTLRLWNVKEQHEVRRLRSPEDFPVAIAVSRDGRHLLTGGREGGTLWDVDRGSPERRLAIDYQVSPGAAAFSPDGRYALLGTSGVILGKNEGSLQLFDVLTGRTVRSLTGHRIPVRALAFAPNGRAALSGSQSRAPMTGELILWDIETGREIRRFDTTKDSTGIAFSADGRRAVTSSAGDFSPVLWDVETGKEIRRFGPHKWPVFAVKFGPGDGTLLSASGDSTVVEWDVATGAPVRRFTSQRSPVFSLDVSADGRYVLSGAQDGTVVEWARNTGEELNRLLGHGDQVLSVAFHPDGRSAFSVSSDGTIIQWRLGEWSVAQLAAWAKDNRYQRALTCEERAQYRVEPLCGAR
jgi:WD40 repeat protein/energy-coupling factor transporter ATP-binding protein EcfA2